MVVVTLFCSPPGSSSFFVCARPWGLEGFTLAVSLRSGRVEFLRGCELDTQGERSLSGHILGCSVSALPVDGLRLTVF